MAFLQVTHTMRAGISPYTPVPWPWKRLNWPRQCDREWRAFCFVEPGYSELAATSRPETWISHNVLNIINLDFELEEQDLKVKKTYEGSLHPQPDGRGIRDLRTLYVIDSQSIQDMSLFGLAFARAFVGSTSLAILWLSGWPHREISQIRGGT